MKELLRSLYRRLPVVRELRRNERVLQRIAGRLEGLNGDLRLLKTAAMVHALEEIKASDERYRDPSRLLAYGAQYWSQNYEDGMIAEIFCRVEPQAKTFLEIGVGDGSENNTTALLTRGWRGCWIESNPESCAAIRARLAKLPSLANRLKLREGLVSPANINELICELGVPEEVDLFSLDIDQDTYHVWGALRGFKPRVVVVEYNGGFPPNQIWIHPYEPGRHWDGTQAFGASLKAFEILGSRLGYSLVGCDVIGANAFFVRHDLAGDRFASPFTAENHYEPPRYGLVYRWAHPTRLFGDSAANT